MSQPRRAAIRIVRVLQEHGYQAYLAGGCVRDRLLGATPKDYDVATDARPDAVRSLFHKTQYVGEAFGVVLVYLLQSQIEVAVFRREWDYQDGRRPLHVAFSDAEHDAQRRDFTINGLFEDPISGRVIDYVAGRTDLEAKVLRAIGNADERLGEDYLRMLRAVRFAADLDLSIHDDTQRAIRQHASNLAQISRERTGQEVRAMLTGPRPAVACELLAQLQLDAPALNEPHVQAILSTLAHLPGEASYAAHLGAWALDRHLTPHKSRQDAFARHVATFVTDQVPDILRRWRRALCMNNDDRDALGWILKLLPQALEWDELSLSRRKRLLSREQWPQVLALLAAIDRPAVCDLALRIREDVGPLMAQGVAPPALVTGDDLIRMGRKPGPEFGRLLHKVYDAQLEGRFTTRDQAIRWLRQILQ